MQIDAQDAAHNPEVAVLRMNCGGFAADGVEDSDVELFDELDGADSGAGSAHADVV